MLRQRLLKRLLILGSLFSLDSGSAYAQSGVANAERAIEAYNKRDFPKAVRLFTLALQDNSLSRPDRELAFLDRGQAHLSVDEREAARRDFQSAVSLDPNDADAWGGLNLAKLPAPQLPDSPFDKGWGAYAQLVGKQWLVGLTSPELHFKATWRKINEAMELRGFSKAGGYYLVRLTLDRANNRLLVESGSGSKKSVCVGTVTAAPAVVITCSNNEPPSMTTLTWLTPTTLVARSGHVDLDRWVDGPIQIFNMTDDAQVASLGWVHKPHGVADWMFFSMGALKGLGDSGQ